MCLYSAGFVFALSVRAVILHKQKPTIPIIRFISFSRAWRCHGSACGSEVFFLIQEHRFLYVRSLVSIVALRSGHTGGLANGTSNGTEGGEPLPGSKCVHRRFQSEVSMSPHAPLKRFHFRASKATVKPQNSSRIAVPSTVPSAIPFAVPFAVTPARLVHYCLECLAPN